jgi:hypothetical protein
MRPGPAHSVQQSFREESHYATSYHTGIPAQYSRTAPGGRSHAAPAPAFHQQDAPSSGHHYANGPAHWAHQACHGEGQYGPSFQAGVPTQYSETAPGIRSHAAPAPQSLNLSHIYLCQASLLPCLQVSHSHSFSLSLPPSLSRARICSPSSVRHV